jgi:hypothetical protein
MRSAHVLAVRAALLGLVLASAGCFRPKILTGGFSCGPGDACPDGLMCDVSQNLCVTTIKDAGAGGSGGTGGSAGKSGQGGSAGMDAGVRDMGPPDRPCLDPIASCQRSDAGMCDPVCNTGCGQCFQKCSVNTNGDLTCNAPSPGPPSAVGVFGQCAQMSAGPSQTDNCAPGEFCLASGECGSRCYQLCRTDNDCPNNASCSRDAGGGNKFCDAPPAGCDPVKGAALSQTYSGCVGGPNTFDCYLSATNLTTTICDCEFSGGRYLDDCVHSRDCFAGLVCYDPSGGTAPSAKCYPVCRLAGDGGADQTRTDAGEQPCNGGAGSCQPFYPPNPVYGYCLGG